MQGLEQSLLRYVRDGVIDLEEACRLSQSPDHLRRDAATALAEQEPA
jgi:Tfp pilus assembly ATPase PilU